MYMYIISPPPPQGHAAHAPPRPLHGPRAHEGNASGLLGGAVGAPPGPANGPNPSASCAAERHVQDIFRGVILTINQAKNTYSNRKFDIIDPNK